MHFLLFPLHFDTWLSGFSSSSSSHSASAANFSLSSSSCIFSPNDDQNMTISSVMTHSTVMLINKSEKIVSSNSLVESELFAMSPASANPKSMVMHNDIDVKKLTQSSTLFKYGANLSRIKVYASWINVAMKGCAVEPRPMMTIAPLHNVHNVMKTKKGSKKNIFKNKTRSSN